MWNQRQSLWIFRSPLEMCCEEDRKVSDFAMKWFENTICSPACRSPILMMAKSVDMVHWLCHNAEHVNSGFWIFINLTWFVKYGPEKWLHIFRLRRSCGPWLGTFLCQKKNWFSFFSQASKNVFGNFQYCLEGHKASLTARQSITICLVNYCWHILADVSIFLFSPRRRQWRNGFFFISVSSEVATMNPPESFDFMINLMRL